MAERNVDHLLTQEQLQNYQKAIQELNAFLMDDETSPSIQYDSLPQVFNNVNVILNLIGTKQDKDGEIKIWYRRNDKGSIRLENRFGQILIKRWMGDQLDTDPLEDNDIENWENGYQVTFDQESEYGDYIFTAEMYPEGEEDDIKFMSNHMRNPEYASPEELFPVFKQGLIDLSSYLPLAAESLYETFPNQFRN